MKQQVINRLPTTFARETSINHQNVPCLRRLCQDFPKSSSLHKEFHFCGTLANQMLFQGKDLHGEPLRALQYEDTSNTPFLEGFHKALSGPWYKYYQLQLNQSDQSACSSFQNYGLRSVWGLYMDFFFFFLNQ